MTSYEGRLELTWTNKHLRLLAHEDGSYEWVSPSDYRVSEVRLLHDVTTVGEVGKCRAADNLLIRGDALNALTSLARLPEFASEYLGKVKLAYLDPPFNTQQSFLQYDDALEHSVWLTMMRDRLLQIRDLLATTGTLWLHLDDAEVHRARCALDEVFGSDNFIATVVWQKVYAPRNDAKTFSTDQDYLLIYAKDRTAFVPNKLSRTRAQNDLFSNPDNDPRGSWQSDNLTVNKTSRERPNLAYNIADPATETVYPFNPQRVWAYEEDRMKRMIQEGRILFPAKSSGRPRIKRYLSEVSAGRVPQTWWPYEEVGHNQDAKREIASLFPQQTAFSTPKPERLIGRIVEIASNPSDIVLDAFVGSGTTAAVAHKMGRRWIAVEREAPTVKEFAIPRLRKVVEGSDPGGVTEPMGWAGGGGFRVLEVASSMFETDGGLVFLADWMTNGALAEATAAQLGFEYEQDPPFAGRKGRTRLAVVDGVVNESVVRLIVSALPERERVVVCGTGIDTDARPILRELRPGSTRRKIPAALLDEYRSARQLRLAFADDATGSVAGNGAKQPVETRA